MNLTDNFTRANSTTTMNPPSDGLANWVVQTAGATWGITSNQGQSITSTSQNTVVRDAGTAVGNVQTTFATASGDCGLIGRSADDNNYILFAFDATGNTLKLFKRVSGTFTEIDGGAVTFTPSSGDVYKLAIDVNNNINCYANGTLKIGPITDSAGSANTKWGLRDNNDTGARFTTFSITDTSPGNVPYSLWPQLGPVVAQFRRKLWRAWPEVDPVFIRRRRRNVRWACMQA